MQADVATCRNNSTEERADDGARRVAEYEELCDTLSEWIATDRVPPDDAYWWTRIALTEATALSELRAA